MFDHNIDGKLSLFSCFVQSFICLLKEIPHRGSFSYVVLDRNEKAYVIEASPRGVEVRQSNVCTNHFELLQHENRHHLDDSKRRMQIIDEEANHSVSAKDAFRLLNDKDCFLRSI